MSGDPIAIAARDLLYLGGGALAGPECDRFLDLLWPEHPAGELYRDATARALARYDLADDRAPEAVAAEVYRNFLWTQFACKLLMVGAPECAVAYAHEHFDASALDEALARHGAAIVTCFHLTGYPLMALGLATGAAQLLVTKARVDQIEQAGSDLLTRNVVYIAKPTAAIALTRALRGGRSTWILVDVVLPSVRTLGARFLGRPMTVSAGLGRIASLSGRPCLPLTWTVRSGGTRIEVLDPVLPGACADDAGIVQGVVDSQGEALARNPTTWLEWYSVLEDDQDIRRRVKSGNEQLWNRLSEALT